MAEKEQTQTNKQPDEDTEILKAVAVATKQLKDLLCRNNIELNYVEADWQDTKALIEESYKLILKHPDWRLYYLDGEELGTDGNYIFFTSKPVDESVIHEAARLIINEGAELQEPVVPKCPKCGEPIDCLNGSYPAAVPATAQIVGSGLYIDIVDDIKIVDIVSDEEVDAWYCPHCDEPLFKADELAEMERFLKGEDEDVEPN